MLLIISAEWCEQSLVQMLTILSLMTNTKVNILTLKQRALTSVHFLEESLWANSLQ